MANQMTNQGLFGIPKKPPNQANSNIEQQFANMSASARAQQDEATRQNNLNIARASNASGGFGGAESKLQSEAQNQLAQKFAGTQADIGAQKAAAMQQQDMFEKEFTENQKTNMVNALTALKTAGFLENAPAAQDRLANFLNRFGQGYSNTTLPGATPGVSEQRKQLKVPVMAGFS